MKIALVFDDLTVGGVERVGVNYAKLLVSLGHDVTVVNTQPKLDDLETDFPAECTIVHARMPIIAVPDFYLPIIRKWWWGKYLYSGTYFISKMCLLAFRALHVKRRRFDIAIAFSGHARDLTYVAYGFVDAQRKLAWVHGSIADFFLMSYSFKNLYLKIRNLCVLSEQNQEKALRFCDVPQGILNITKIYNPIDQEPQPSDPQRIAQLKEEYGDFLLMVGRFDVDKDQATVLRAQRVLKEEYRLAPYVLFVGDGPTRASCEALAEDLGIKDKAVFLGTQRNVDDYYCAAYATIHSSPSEGLPTVLLESMRCGTPVIATNSLPGVPEILEDERYGLICKVGDHAEMASKMAMLMRSSELRDELRERGRQRLQDFSEERISKELVEILANLQP